MLYVAILDCRESVMYDQKAEAEPDASVMSHQRNDSNGSILYDMKTAKITLARSMME